MKMDITNQYLFDEASEAIRNGYMHSFHDGKLHNFLLGKIKDIVSDDTIAGNIVINFLKNLRLKWKTVNRNKNLFLSKYEGWLAVKVYKNPANETPKKSRGRPRAESFQGSSEKTKRRKTAELVNITPQRLTYATSRVLRMEGQSRLAKSLAQISTENPSTSSENNTELCFSANEALALILDCGLSKRGYQNLRNKTLEKKSKVFPPYNNVRSAKEECLPSPENWLVTDYSAEVTLQDLLDHTTRRILEVASFSEADFEIEQFKLICKVGFDGTTGQSVYKQIRSDNQERNVVFESCLFVTCMLPLKLSGKTEANEEIILWKNNKPSSPLFCRPIRFKFIKETTEVLVQEEQYLKDAIQKLGPTQVQNNVSVIHDVSITMIDGKVASSLSLVTNSMQCCSLCGASPKLMNDIEEVSKRSLSNDGIMYGLSTLHAWIRTMECCLHLSYKMPIKKWQARTKEEKAKVQEQKSKIQKAFRDRTGLVIDMPKQSGFGTSNDGNTARRFFQLAETSSEILGIKIELLKNLHIILCTLSSGLDINVTAFKSFCINTAKMYVEEYNWYYMPQSLHRILIHGSSVIEQFNLPIGLYSEEAQEAKNKDFKKFRESFCRKISRKKTNEDLMRRLFCSSDPLITSMRNQTKSISKKDLPDEARLLIITDSEISSEGL